MLRFGAAPVEANARRIGERVAAGDHDLVAVLEAIEDLHGVDSRGADPDRAFLGDAMLDDIGEPAAVLLDELAAQL